MTTINWQLILAIGMAALPAVIWSSVLMARSTKHRRLLFTVFLGGTLTVFPVLGLQKGYHWLIAKFPTADFVASLQHFVENVPYAWTVVFFIYVGIVEEIAKFLIVRYADYSRPDLIQSVNDSVYFAMLSGLGFAFSENIFYFYAIVKSQTLSVALTAFIFRAVVTVCAHAMFSGIFGYYYGMSKFSYEFIKMKEWQGQSPAYLQNLRKIFAEDLVTTNRYLMLLMGLLCAMGFHAVFNIYLQFGKAVPVVILIAAMFIMLTYLLRSRAGKLAFVLADYHPSTMKAEDEKVIMELVGMWYNDKRYQEVINICKRLLRRDPDNNVAKLFLAKAIDQKKRRHLWRALGNLFDDKDEGVEEKTLI